MYQNNQQEYDHLFKLLLIGNSGVGKSCMLMRYSENSFTNNFYNTIGVDFKIKSLQIEDRNIKLQIWDTAGQDRFRTITNSYYRGAHGILIVYDITDKESFENVRTWCSEIEKHAQENVNKMLVGNKCDQQEKRQVTYDQGMELAKQFKMPYMETSAKNAHNIDLCFTTITRNILQRVGNSTNPKEARGVRLNKNKNMRNNKQQVQQQQESDSCC
ncbi:P-loop containing nucleoside triphosphate hydrolase [Pseudocohnilembus persalinus]|uniref:Ras-related protein Rab-1 n=1 Tax=Pseudocohnilembus persalinus TaxID=266149 RepID=A0A0V0Q8P3_PSEPJ|nr:P-loop containing nucleoside triphosphate hydrolase [Pseudocohnilembus persalinus]|eukprot:KRW98601.1 P-loop containing nucleoside triphosphate hydrolase [Pseudocohnilembus persalinus]